MHRSASIPDSTALLRLLQLASPSLPVGAYSYSEGIEYAVEQGAIRNAESLRHWIEDALQAGGARFEGMILLRAYDAARRGKADKVRYWNVWLSAARESEELRMQNHDMGRALLRLLGDLNPPLPDVEKYMAVPCNFAIAFALAAAHWKLPCNVAVTSYLQSWATNLVGAGVKLIPLGQTAGQQLLWQLQQPIEAAAQAVLRAKDENLVVSNWGHALASMRHETQYSRLFRS